LLWLVPAPAQAVDLISELDKTVIAIHDYSVINGSITSKASTASIKDSVSKMNKQLSVIRASLLTFDKDVTKNWTFLGATDNAVYPARTTLRNYDLSAFSWYSFELAAQQKITNCYKQSGTAKACVLNLHAKNKKVELARYSKMSTQLKVVEKWRLAAKR
jgi:hypothetical protein